MRNLKSEGMTLIEVLVAFIILAMTMSVILRINSGAVRNHQLAMEYVEAVAVARSRLEQMGAEVDVEHYSREGVDRNSYSWRYLRQPYDWQEQKLLASPMIPIEEILTLSWDSPAGVREISFTRIGAIRAKP